MRFRRLFHRRAFERDMDDEMRFHIEARMKDLFAQGLSHEEAGRQARVEFGALTAAKEDCRRTSGYQWIESLGSDLRYTARTLRRSPLFTIVAVGILACGIGACTAMFSVVNSVLLRPLPYPNSDRIVRILTNNPILHVSNGPTSYADAQDWTRSGLFQSVGIYSMDHAIVNLNGRSETVLAGTATHGLFGTLGVRPVRGRLFMAREDVPSEAPVAVLTERFWRRRFGGNDNVLGSTLRINGRTVPVVGIIPAVFGFDLDPELWVSPTGENSSTLRFNRFWKALGRLSAGATRVQTQDRLRQVCRRLAEAFPDSNKGWGVDLVDLRESVVGDFKPQLLVLLGSVLFVLLVVCANVASLFLLRATARERELAIRTALGASRRRVARQILTETGVIAFLGAGLGCVIALAAVALLRARGPSDLPRLEHVGVDGYSLLFAAGLAVFTTILSGLAPGLQGSLVDRQNALHDTSRFSTGSRRRGRLRSWFVVSEVALSVLLMSGAGLLLKAFHSLSHEDVGFRTGHLLTAFIDMPAPKYLDHGKYRGDKVARYAQAVTDALRTLPGASNAAAGMYVPVNGGGYVTWRRVFVEGDMGPQAHFVHGVCQSVTPEYFETLGIPRKAGRLFEATDDARGQQVVIVDEAFVRARFPGENPVGRHILLEGEEQPRVVVGVVGDIQPELPSQPKPPEVYAPMAQEPIPALAVFVRAQQPDALARSLERAVLDVDPDIPAFRVRTQDEVVAEALASKRFVAALMAGFAAAAVLLATIGLYGVIAYAVAQRTREFGVRLALGANAATLTAEVVAQGTRLLAVGIAIGMIAALALTRALSALLYHVDPRDAMVLSIVAGIIFAAGIASCWLPARSVQNIQPASALRAE